MHISSLLRGLKRNSRLTFVRAFSYTNPFIDGKDHYKTLNLDKGCSDKDVRDAYIRLSKEHHPDKNLTKKTEDSEKRFVEIHEAYSVLGKPATRRRYDEYRAQMDDEQEFATPYDELMHRYKQHNDLIQKRAAWRAGRVREERTIPLMRLIATVLVSMLVIGIVEFNIVRSVVQGPDEIIEGMPIYHSNMVPSDLSGMTEEQQEVYKSTKRRILEETVRSMNAERDARLREQNRLRIIIKSNREQESSPPSAKE